MVAMADTNETQTGNPQQTEKLAVSPELKAKAREFFQKGAEVAYALQYDYAIELYLDGLSRWPDTVEQGHKPLREIALRRQAAGKKKSGFGDSSRYKKLASKSPKEHMLKAEYLLSKDPGNTGHMEDLIKAAVDGDYRETAGWFADLLFDANLQKDKPSFQTFVFLRDVYRSIESFARALQACQKALQIKPNDAALLDIMRDLSANNAVQQGRYDDDGDFRESIQNREEQERAQAGEALVQSKETRADAIAQARTEYQASPEMPAKITKLVNALCATEELDNENEAITVLEKAYAQSGQFHFQQRAGDISIKQLARQLRAVRSQLKQDSQNEQLQEQLQDLQQLSVEVELEHYKLCAENYPTDMRIKYEYGRRMLNSGQYDDAIPVLQDARSDPKLRIPSQNAIGQCFFQKKWYPDAVETFQQALEMVSNSEDAIAKELRYNLGRAYEADGNAEEALACFRKIAQIDFNFRDVRSRVDALRKQQDG